MIVGACKEYGAKAEFLGIAKDNEKEIETLLKKALKYDAVIISGGTSASRATRKYMLTAKAARTNHVQVEISSRQAASQRHPRTFRHIAR